MSILRNVAQAVQQTLSELAEAAGQAVGIIRRRRKLTAPTLAQTLIWAVAENPAADWNDFAGMAQTLGVEITANGIKQRFTTRLVDFLKHLLIQGMTKLTIAAPPLPAPLLERFAAVYLGDSTTLRLPDELAGEFPGCGGSKGAGRAALKIQVRMNLASGEIDYFQFEPGKECDVKSPLQDAPTAPGSLVIQDLGYFDIGKLAERSARGVHWISRIQCGTTLWRAETEETWNLMSHLQSFSGPVLDVPVRLGAEDRLPCRLLAVRCPSDVTHARRRKLKAECKRKGRTPSQERLAWCDWFILVTDLSAEDLSWQEAVVLSRSRWQIELLFKLWKSHGLIAWRLAQTVEQQMGLCYTRLIAVLLKHWLILSGTGNQLRRSLPKAAEVVSKFIRPLVLALKHGRSLEEVLADLGGPLKLAIVDRRKSKPSWFQLITDPGLLDWKV